MSFVQSRMMILSVAVFLQAFVFSAAEGADPKPPPVSNHNFGALTEGDDNLSLLKAAEAGDIARFDKEMEKLLLGPFSLWAKALFATDRSRQNLFHKMAQLKRRENQKAFAERMKVIIELIFTPSSKIAPRLFREDNERDYSLSGVNLFQQGVENQFIMRQSVEDSRRALREKLLEILSTRPAVSVLASLYDMTGSREIPSSAIFNEWYGENLMKVSMEVRFKTPAPPYLAEDHRGFSPIALADRAGNIPAYNELKKTEAFHPYNNKKDNRAFLIGVVAGAGMGWFGAPYLAEDVFQILSFPPAPTTAAEEWIMRGWGAAVAGLATAVAGVYSSRCYRLFRRKIKNHGPADVPPAA